MKGPHFSRYDFTYGDILRDLRPLSAPSVCTMADPVAHECKDCGTRFEGPRNAKRCPACRPAAQRRSMARAYNRRKAHRVI